MNSTGRLVILGLVCTFAGLCLCSWCYAWCRKNVRIKKDIIPQLGVAMARIQYSSKGKYQLDVENAPMGIGTDPVALESWLDDIWRTYDADDDGEIDKGELKRWIDHTLKVGGIKFPYSKYDLDEVFDKIDITETGRLTRAEMRQFLRSIGSVRPPEKVVDDITREVGRRLGRGT